MTTTEIIELLRDDAILTSRVLAGFNEDKKEVFMKSHGIQRTRQTPKMLAHVYNRSETTIHHWIGQVIIHLRSPQRIHLIKAYLKDKQRQKHWFWRRWDWAIACWIKIVERKQ